MTDTPKTKRFPKLTIADMSPDQRRIAEGILNSRRMPSGTKIEPTHALGGPFNTLLQNPDLLDRLQHVGEYLRFDTSLPGRLSEFAILLTARHWRAQYEWFAHQPIAVAEGLKPEVTADLAAFRRPTGMAEDEEVVYDFCVELRRDREVSDPTFARALALFGHRGVVDLIAISGYYDLVSMILNVSQVNIPRGQPLPLGPETPEANLQHL